MKFAIVLALLTIPASLQADDSIKQGITAGVLKYRLPNPKSSDQPSLVPLTDTRRALKLFRTYSDNYRFDKKKLGVIGFSAGRHFFLRLLQAFEKTPE